MKVEDQTKELVQRLAHPWWSPLRPDLYMKAEPKDYGRFNLYWALNGRPRGIPADRFNIGMWHALGRLCKQDALGGTVGEAATLLLPTEFYRQVVVPWTLRELAFIAPKTGWEYCLCQNRQK